MQTLPNGLAPAPARGNKGNKGGKVALAWQDAWNELGVWRNGRELAGQVAPPHDVKPVSLLTHIIRMVKEGHLEVAYQVVPQKVMRYGKEFDSARRVAFYRIKPRAQAMVDIADEARHEAGR